MITCQVETWAHAYPEMEALWPLHYADLSQDKDDIKLGVDCDRYAWIEAQGGLHVVTVRSDGKLVGYYIATILPHLHYKDAGLMGYTDVYYILPDFRKGGAGLRMLKCAERTLKARGVRKMYLSHKFSQDHTALFEALGFKATDKVYTKLLK